MRRAGAAVLACAIFALAGCLRRPTADPNIIVASMTTGPNNLDPRLGTDDSSEKLHKLIFESLITWNDRLQLVPQLAERFDHPEPLTYVARLRRGVHFHDGHELTAADVVYTFRSTLDPALLSPKRGALHELASIEATDPYSVVFTLSRPFESFPNQRRRAAHRAGRRGRVAGRAPGGNRTLSVRALRGRRSRRARRLRRLLGRRAGQRGAGHEDRSR